MNLFYTFKTLLHELVRSIHPHYAHPSTYDESSVPTAGSSGPIPSQPVMPLRRHLLCCAAILLSFTCLVLLSITVITEMSRAALASRVADQVLRFHVIAHSDSEEDQALKLQVRDALITYMSDHRASFDSADEAAAWAADHCRQLQQIAQDVIAQAGYGYTVSAAVTTCSFPEKTYGNLTFPAGEYQALRVEIGQAQGQNWWCVLYPLLCFTEEGMVTVPEESQEILQESLSEKDYRRLEVRFGLWDFICNLFS